MSKAIKIKKVNQGVIWVCPACGAYNLNEVGWDEFGCVNCEYILYAPAHGVYVEIPQ